MLQLKSFMRLSAAFVPREIALATSTYYPRWYKGKLRSLKNTDKVRGDLALEFIKQAKALGYRVVVVDGKSSRSFCLELRRFSDIKVINRRSPQRSPARREAITIASKISGVKVIVLTEPEKISLVKDCLPLVIEPVIKNHADIVVPKRDEVLFRSTHPLYMYESEVEANKVYNQILKSHGLLNDKAEDLDMFFGPKVLRNDKKIIALFMRRFYNPIGDTLFSKAYFDPEEYSNTLYFPVVLALKKKLKVKSVTVPFRYPNTQKDNEEKGVRELFLEKRRSQRLSILLDLTYFIGFLQKNQRSKA